MNRVAVLEVGGTHAAASWVERGSWTVEPAPAGRLALPSDGSADDLLFTTDLFIEGVHFLRETHKAADVARKALARSLSDIAAMGGTPTFFLASVCLPKSATDRWIQEFFETR